MTDEELLKTFNLGWGFTTIVSKSNKDDIIDSFEKNKIEAEEIGKIVDTETLVAIYDGNRITLSQS